MWLAMLAGRQLSSRRRPMEHDEREYFTIVLSASLTLLGLIIGFTFSMAITRYDLRKHYEETEANAIGTEFIRADLLPADETPKLQDLLRTYLGVRVRFYEISFMKPGGEEQLQKVNVDTEWLQTQLWHMVQTSSSPHGTATMALVAAGMNDVLNAQGYAQAAWWNRVPGPAWVLMGLIAVGCNFLMGFGVRRTQTPMLSLLPVLIAISFFLIADIDSPRGGVIRVRPDNLLSLANNLNSR